MTLSTDKPGLQRAALALLKLLEKYGLSAQDLERLCQVANQILRDRAKPPDTRRTHVW